MAKKCIMGIDVGSVSVKVVIINLKGKILYTNYSRSKGKPVEKLKEIFQNTKKISDYRIRNHWKCKKLCWKNYWS